MIILISYDLKVPGKKYDSLYEAIKKAPSWWHYLDSTWLVRTNESVTTWNDRLTKILDENDRLLIVDVTKRERNGWPPKRAWDWIRENEVL